MKYPRSSNKEDILMVINILIVFCRKNCFYKLEQELEEVEEKLKAGD